MFLYIQSRFPTSLLIIKNKENSIIQRKNFRNLHAYFTNFKITIILLFICLSVLVNIKSHNNNFNDSFFRNK